MVSKPTTPKASKAPTKPRTTTPKVAEPAVDAAMAVSAEAGLAEVGLAEVEAEVVAATDMRLKDLLDQVTRASGFKKKDVKLVVEATLARMATALQQGQSMNLTGLGRLRVVRPAVDGGAMTLKLRMATPGAKPAAEAAGDEDGNAE